MKLESDDAKKGATAPVSDGLPIRPFKVEAPMAKALIAQHVTCKLGRRRSKRQEVHSNSGPFRSSAQVRAGFG